LFSWNTKYIVIASRNPLRMIHMLLESSEKHENHMQQLLHNLQKYQDITNTTMHWAWKFSSIHWVGTENELWKYSKNTTEAVNVINCFRIKSSVIKNCKFRIVYLFLTKFKSKERFYAYYNFIWKLQKTSSFIYMEHWKNMVYFTTCANICV
jgi:hypothetical protein